MCAALQRAITKRELSQDGLLGWVLGQDSEEEIEPGLQAGEFLVDFSAIELLRDMRLTTISPAVVNDMGWTLKGKAVLIGDGETNDTRDTFPIPDSNHTRGVPGIFKHASAVYTLINAPLYELTALGRVTVDVLLSLMVLVPVAFFHRLVTQRTNSQFAERTAVGVFTAVVTLVVLIVGVVLVHQIRVMWDDFLFVIIALWLHRPIAEAMRSFWPAAKKLPAALIGIFSKPESEESQ
jgi:CHASE2 domain-containing sensor protein